MLQTKQVSFLFVYLCIFSFNLLMAIICTAKNMYRQASNLLDIVHNTNFEKLWKINMLVGPDAFYID